VFDVDQIIAGGVTFTISSVVGTVCWCVRERCRRRSRTALIRDYSELLAALRSQDGTPPPVVLSEWVGPPLPDQIEPPDP
jgi:hypothetical protein